MAALIFAPSYYFYAKYRTSQKLLEDPKYLQRQETQSLVEEVGKLIELPDGEEPTIAEVSDKDRLSSQQFFAKAENGDKVLIYTKAKKAFLYRPTTKKIIEVGPVSIGETLSPTAGPSGNSAKPTTNLSPSPQASVRVAIYNASKIIGLAASTEARLKSQFANITVVQKANSKGDYIDNAVFDLRGNLQDTAQKLADSVGGELEQTLPSSESRPDADILIIVAR